MSDVDIANEILGLAGCRDTINAIDNSTNEGEKIQMFWEPTRDEILQMAQWGFANAVKRLTLFKQAPGTPGGDPPTDQWSDDYPAPPWLYSYHLPDDEFECLAVRAIVPILNNYNYPSLLAAAAAFEIGHDTDSGQDIQVILTNQADAIAVYTKKIEDSGIWSPLFRAAFKHAMAAKITMPLTGDKDQTKILFGLANGYILEARANHANQGLTVIDQQAAWMVARVGECNALVIPGNFVMPYAPLYIS